MSIHWNLIFCEIINIVCFQILSTVTQKKVSKALLTTSSKKVLKAKRAFNLYSGKEFQSQIRSGLSRNRNLYLPILFLQAGVEAEAVKEKVLSSKKIPPFHSILFASIERIIYRCGFLGLRGSENYISLHIELKINLSTYANRYARLTWG